MKNVLRVSEARARFGEILDEAEQGSPVVIERRGVRFRLVAEPRAARRSAGRLFEYVDRDVMSANWTWQQGPGGVRFVPRSRK
jgi:antitoxin (DNA-binding transcriptional repressor) of toxin-antitoxin stability system